MPTLTIIAGPNGSGKSTATRLLNFPGRDRLLDPDRIARELNPSNPSAAAMAAGRAALQRMAEYLDERLSFGVETTLSSRQMLDLIRRAKAQDFEVRLLFVALDTPERSIARIRNRAIMGQHAIPEVDVRRRYPRSLANAAEAVRLVDAATFYDNSGIAARLVLVAKAGVVVWQADPLPDWLKL